MKLIFTFILNFILLFFFGEGQLNLFGHFFLDKAGFDCILIFLFLLFVVIFIYPEFAPKQRNYLLVELLMKNMENLYLSLLYIFYLQLLYYRFQVFCLPIQTIAPLVFSV